MDPAPDSARPSLSPPSARTGLAASLREGLAAYARGGIAGLHPAYFAVAMATGIVAIASHLLGLTYAARALYWVNLVAYALVWAAMLARLTLFPARFLEDVRSHPRGPGYFTVVAATGVLGSQVTLMGGALELGRALFWLAAVLWVICTYAVFVALAVREGKPSLADGINGGWLLAVVATQSLPVLGCVAGPDVLGDPEISMFVLVSFWLCGGMLYVWLISLIFYRYMFFRFEPSDLMPPYWINMGAVAISTLAGALLVGAAARSPAMAPLVPFIKGVTLAFWATATWWIPMLLLLGAWRYAVRRVRFAYDPLYWGLVFPLGMYSVCTYRLSGALDAPFLVPLAKAFVVAALVAWLVTALGLAGRLLPAALLALRARSPERRRNPSLIAQRGEP